MASSAVWARSVIGSFSGIGGFGVEPADAVRLGHEAQLVARRDLEVGVEHGAEQRAIDLAGDQRVGAERLDHARRRLEAAGRDGEVLGADGELELVAGALRAIEREAGDLPAAVAARAAGMKFIGGLPMKLPTKRAAGLR